MEEDFYINMKMSLCVDIIKLNILELPWVPRAYVKQKTMTLWLKMRDIEYTSTTLCIPIISNAQLGHKTNVHPMLNISLMVENRKSLWWLAKYLYDKGIPTESKQYEKSH